MLIRNHVAIVVVGIGIAVGSAYQIGTGDAVVKRLLSAQLMQRVRAPCAIRDAGFEFLKGVQIKGLVVLDPAAPFGPPLLAAESARADFKLGAFGEGPRITNVDIFRPRLRIDRAADGTVPVMQIFEFGGAGPSPRPFFVKLRGGEATYSDAAVLAGGPLALTNVDIDVTPADPASADWAQATVGLKADSDVLGPIKATAIVGEREESFGVTIDLARIRFDASVPRRFRGNVAGYVAGMSPAGEATSKISARIEKGRDLAPTIDVELHDASVRVTLPDDPAPKPIDVTKISGRLRFADGRLVAKDLVFHALGADFHVEASIDGVASASTSIDLTAAVERIPLDESVRACLPRAYRRIAEAYDVRGTVGVKATVRGGLASPAVGVAATLSNGHVRYDGFLDESDGKRYGFAYDIEDVEGTVTVDGPTVRIDGVGRHGPASVRGAGTVVMAGGGHDVPDLTFVAENVPLDDSVRKAFNDGGAKSFDPWKPSGTAARITVRVTNDPVVEKNHDAVDVTIDVDGRAGFVPHVFPAAFSNVSGRIEVLEPIVGDRRGSLVRLTDLAAKGDGFDVRVSGEIWGAAPADSNDLQVHADVAECAGAFRDALDRSELPPEVIKTAAKLGPAGPLVVNAHVVRAADGKRGDVVDFTLAGTSVTGYDDVPLAARRLTGRVHLEGDDLTFEDVAGEFVMGDFAPQFRAHGRLAALSAKPQPTIHVEAAEIPLGDGIRGVLGPLATKAEGFWNIVAPVGSVRADCVLDLRPDADPTPFEILLTSIHGALRPLGLEIDCDGGTFRFDGRRAEVRGLDAAIGAATLRFDSVDYDKETGEVDIRTSALRSLRFPEDLEGPLSKETVERIAASAPGRTMHAPTLHVAYRPSPSTLEIDGDVMLRPRTRRATPDPGYAPEGALAIERLAFVMPDDGPVTFDGAARATDFAFRVGLAVDQFNGPVTFAGDLGEAPRFRVHAAAASFRVEEFPFEQVDVFVVPTRNGERVEVERAKFMSGDLTCKVGQGEGGVGYQGWLKLDGADLERFLRSRGSSGDEVATGVVDAELKFHNPTGVRADLRGDGKIAVGRGNLLRAPGLSAVAIKVATAGLITADLTDAEMKFDLEGDRLLVKKLEVKSSGANALANGRGWIELGGRLDVSLDAISFDIPVIRQILGLLQKALFRVRVTGTLRNPSTTTEWISLGGADGALRAEPPPAGDVRPPDRDPW